MTTQETAEAKKRRDTLYYFFSGKGGVGKTSIAAAAALRFAMAGRRTLIISIDPAHSLSDSFGKRIGPDIRRLRENLFAVEIDPARAMDEYREKITPRLEKMEMLQGLGLGDTFDIAGMTPGIDEIAAFDKFLQYLHDASYDVIIFDTAPTGHALRFLSLPDVLDSWVGKLIRLRLQLSGMFGLMRRLLPFGSSGEEAAGMQYLDTMKQRIAEAKAILSDPQRTRFVIVLIPEAMSILESSRSLTVLASYRIPVSSVVINQVIPANPGCGFCSGKRALQLKRIAEAQKAFARLPLSQVPLFRAEVRGFAMLEDVGTHLPDW